MKVYIWVHKSDAVAGTVTDYELTRPYHDRNEEWVQVSISTDDFAQLEDIIKDENLFRDEEAMAKNTPTANETDYRSDSWRVSQYNRNREHNDRIEDIDDMDQNNAPFGD